MSIDKIMEQVQVFASSWAIAGSRFDDGSGMQVAEREKTALRNMIELALRLSEEKC